MSDIPMSAPASPAVIARAAAAAGEAAYHWHLASDRLDWSGNAAAVLGIADPSRIATGRGFARYLDPDNAANRHDAVMQAQAVDRGDGVAYALEYRIRPQGRDAEDTAWVEDQGRWFAGPDGRPAEAFGVVRRIDDRQRRDERLQYLSDCDALTGMMNRARFDAALAELAGETGAHGQGQPQTGFFLLSIANLAVINEAYGFDLADEVICEVGARLKAAVRGGDIIARYSGTKFALLSRGCDEELAGITAERLLKIMRDRFIETSRGPVWARLAAGIVLLPRHADKPALALALAEEALSEARRMPTDGFVLHQPSPERLSLRMLNSRCVGELVESLHERRLELDWQPIIEGVSGDTFMYEGLLRMRCHDGEIIPAAHLIPVAEQLGLVRLVDQRVVELAIAALTARPGDRLSINVSAITATDARWFSQIASLLADSRDIITGRLVIEITETAVLTAPAEVQRFAARLREAGCLIAIDDFGAGHTSLRNLQLLAPDFLKLDGSFCERLAENEVNQIFVRSLVELAQKFGLKTIAEWVERPQDAKLLMSWGVDYLQGFLYDAAAVSPPEAAAVHSGVSEDGSLEDVRALLDAAFARGEAA